MVLIHATHFPHKNFHSKRAKIKLIINLTARQKKIRWEKFRWTHTFWQFILNPTLFIQFRISFAEFQTKLNANILLLNHNFVNKVLCAIYINEKGKSICEQMDDIKYGLGSKIVVFPLLNSLRIQCKSYSKTLSYYH